MTYTEQLERETEQTRAQLADTLDELRASVTPGQVVDQLIDYAQDSSGGEFFGNLKRHAASNPLPVTLISAGLAWLMFSSGNGSGRGVAGRAGRRLGHAADDVRDSIGNAAESVARSGEKIAEGSRSVASAAGELTSSTYEAASRAYEDVTHRTSRTAAAVTDTAKTIGRSATATGGSVADFCSNQPLVLAGLGIAVGAAFGAILPSTDTENDLMGEASDKAKEKAQDTAADVRDKAKAVGEHAAKAARDETERQGWVATPDDHDGTGESLGPAAMTPERHEERAGQGARGDGHGAA